MMPFLARPAAALLLALAAAGCASAPAPSDSPSPATTAPPAAAAPSPTPVRGTGGIETLTHTEADVHFMTGMIGHHAQAVEMSRLAPERASSPAVRTLAARIINGQQGEIATMQGWLRDRGLPVPAATGAAHAHGAHGGHGGHTAHGTAMPGMLSAAQMQRLSAARGAEFDRLFLQYMIQHHRGAVHMVRTLFATTGAGQEETVFRFATDVNVDQTTEIARMQRMLADLILGSGAP